MAKRRKGKQVIIVKKKSSMLKKIFKASLLGATGVAAAGIIRPFRAARRIAKRGGLSSLAGRKVN